MKNMGAVTIVPAYSWTQKVFAKVDWHVDPAGDGWRQRRNGGR